jgi:hypothetical protein
MSKLLRTFLVLILFSFMLASCGRSVKETYIMTSLREATRGDILSPGFRYAFDTPKFIAAHKNVALVREGNLIEFFTGDDIETKIKEVEGKKFTLGARKLFSPMIHFTVDFLVAGGDTTRVYQAFNVKFPNLLAEFEGDFIDVELNMLTSHRLRLNTIQDSKFEVKKGFITYEEVVLEDEPQMVFLLNLENVRFIIDEPSDEISLILKALMSEHLYFEGAVSYSRIPTKGFRDRTRSGGKVKIDYVRYCGKAATS